MVRELPSGTVTLLFTDIEGSTRMLQELGREAYVRALTEHRRLLRNAFTSHGGVEVEMQGDSFFFAFPFAREAVAAAAAAQRALAEHRWEQQPIKVRIGLHTGEPMEADGLYAGLDVHWAARVMSAGHGGQILLSARTADLVRTELTEIALRDLGEHRLKDLTAAQRLYQAGKGDFPPLKTLTRQSDLPVAATPMIGREAELESLLTLLRAGSRLVTVIGPGGAGKTRLALQAAAELLEEYSDGVFWVPLAGLRSPDLVLASVAQTVGAHDDLATHLSGRETLLVLDNFEHVLAASAPLAQLLASAPSVRALVTSRAPLHVDGEHEFPLDPLDIAAGVTLFVERARTGGRTVQGDGTVAEICRRLDNLPLALELAASRTKLLAPEALLGRLEKRLPLLTGGRRDAPEHQRTLRATIEWSYELLPENAKELLARMSIFAGSFSLDAAENVCDADLDTVAALVDLSLLKPIDDERLLLLDTIREYASERLGSDRPDLQRRHAEWFLAEVERAENELVGPNQRAWLRRLEADYDNVRAVLGSPIDDEIALRLAAAMGGFWRATRYISEGRLWLDRVLTARSGSARSRARALSAAGELAIHQDDYSSADRLLTQAESLFEEVGDTAGGAEALAMKAWILRLVGNLDQALETIEQALTLARDSTSRPPLARTLRVASVIVEEAGDKERGRMLAEESLALRRELGDEFGIAVLVADLAMAALRQRDPAAATAYGEESLALLEGPSNATAAVQHTLAVAGLALGDTEAARQSLFESLSTFKNLRDVQGIAVCLEATAALAGHAGKARLSAVVAAAAASLFKRHGMSDHELHPVRGLYEANLVRARAELDENEWSTACLEGSSLSDEEAAELALAWLAEPIGDGAGV